MPGSHETQAHAFEGEQQEKTEAEKRIATIKKYLLSNTDCKEKIYESMKSKPSIQRILNTFGENEKTQNFTINEFFSQQQAGFTLQKGEDTYSIMWRSSYPHLGQAIDINRRSTTGDNPYNNEQISLNTWNYPRLRYEIMDENNRSEKRGISAQESIDLFLENFLQK